MHNSLQQPRLSPGIGCRLLYLKFLNSGETEAHQPHCMDFTRILILVLPVRSLDGKAEVGRQTLYESENSWSWNNVGVGKMLKSGNNDGVGKMLESE